ncbi:MAG: L-type lectin-domain containing protein [Saprospiraceae bacterium]
MKKLLLILCLLPLTLMGQKHKIFKYDEFKVTKKLKLIGNAKFIDGGIRLTPASPWQRGACWYREKVAVAKGFTIEFQMKISKSDLTQGGADGIAFVIQNDPTKLGLGEIGEGMGYTGLANCLAVEFDTYDNDEGSNNHVGIQCNKKGKVTRYSEHKLAINHRIPKLRGSIRKVKIVYKNKRMKVSIDGKKVLDEALDLNEKLDLAAGKAWIGFTSATAGAYSQQEIIYWKWDSVDIPIASTPNENDWKVDTRKSLLGTLRKEEFLG